MYKKEVIEQGDRALNEMISAREAYCKSKNAAVTEDVFGEIIDPGPGGSDIDCCCLGMIVILLLAVPFLIIGKIEKSILDKKAQPIMKKAREECDLGECVQLIWRYRI